MANEMIGLSAILPVEFETNPKGPKENIIVLVGWRVEIERGIKKYILLLEDGRECKAMQANLLLQKLSDFEQSFRNTLMPAIDGLSMKYAKPILVAFGYTAKGKGASFVSPYSDIKITFKQNSTNIAAPNPAAPQKVLGG